MQQFVDGVVLHDVFTVGYRNLKKHMATINDLNVFPVPDGDTGTNMAHTFGGGLAAVTPCGDVDVYMQALARAVLLCARGNSGVIFSQFVGGFTRGLQGKQEICFADFREAFRLAQEDAYKSILTPTEGTMLTLIREAADFLADKADTYRDFKAGLDALIACMKESLAKTPDLLPVLKEAGVVDSGAAGLLCFFEGMYAYFCGISIDDMDEEDFTAEHPTVAANFGPDSVMEYGYCTEFILQLMNAKTDIDTFSKEEFVKPLEAMGDSIVAVVSGGIVKIHIHTFTPEAVLAYARQYGEFVTLKIENMSVQHSETQTESKKEKVKYAVVPVASGEGIIDYFYNIGATVVVNGGQTNNPSVDDFLKALEPFEAEHVILLPNNSNIILTANQVAELYRDATVHVIPTKSIVEGYSALSMMDLWCDDVETLIADMSAGLSNAVSASVTTATRDAVIGGVAIKQNEFLGIKGKEIVLSHSDRYEAVTALIDHVMAEDEKAVIVVFHGKNVPADEIDALQEHLENNYPLTDVGFVDGKQDVYDYIISME